MSIGHHRGGATGVAIFSVGSGLRSGLIAAAITHPDTADRRTLARAGRRIDYAYSWTPAPRQLDNGMDVIASAAQSESTSGAAIVIAAPPLCRHPGCTCPASPSSGDGPVRPRSSSP